MKFPSPAKDFITFQWPNDFTLAQIDQIRIAVAACESTGLGFVAWEIPTKAEVMGTTDIALALSDSYGSLLALRSVQSITISSTQALCQGAVADISTSAERGQYAAFLALPTILGPSLGPVIGGVITVFVGWRNNFWFLAITGGINPVVLLLIFPETCRHIVGDGSFIPSSANRTCLQWLYHRLTSTAPRSRLEKKAKAVFVWARFLSALILIFEKEIFLLSTYGGLLFVGLYAVGTAAPNLFSHYYGYNGLKIGLLYLPLAAGSVVTMALVGKAMKWNFHRHAKRLGIIVDKSRQTELSHFPIEKARVEVLVSPFLLSVLVITAWGWTVEQQACVGLGLSGSAITLGAAMSAAIEPLIPAVNPGKAFSIIAAFYVILSPCLVLVVRKGMKWRQNVREKDQRAVGMSQG
ncbi:MFS general substrate transporter [Xylariaceae sp. FL0255]|nr:MFS general substrate transporter [Xylariaceae sp. FL0255]